MSFIQLIAARTDIPFSRNLSLLNLLSIVLLGVAVCLPLTSSLIVLFVSMLVQAAFFRIMHREKAGTFKLVKRLIFLLASSVAIMVILFQNHLL